MSQLEIIGRTVGYDGTCGGGSRDDRPISQKTNLSLCEAAALAGRSVEELKRAIRAGELRAERRGWWRIHRGDLNEFLYGILPSDREK